MGGNRWASVISWGELNCIHTKISDLDLPLWLPSGLWSYCGTENTDIAACHLAFRHSHLDLYAACSSFIKKHDNLCCDWNMMTVRNA